MTPHVRGSEPSTHTFGAPPAERTSVLETAAHSPRTIPELAEPLHAVHPIFGDYELLHLAGEGGMGVVYQARHRDTDRIVALKTMKANAALSPDLAARFQREIRTADAVRHANIVPVLDVGEYESRFYYTMPYAPTNLGRERHRFRDPRAAAEIGATIARALQYAHAQGIVHRDLKPANILLDGDDEPMIADFGLARWVDASQVLTQSLAPIGTPAYMAPEQASGPSHELSGSADIWSLGVILYELLTGQRPFEAANTDALFYQIRSADPLPLRAFRPDLDPALESIVLLCLCKDRAGRYPTAGALAEDLERWLDGKPVRAQLAPTATALSPVTQSRGLSPRTMALTLLGLCMGGLLIWGAAALAPDRTMTSAGIAGALPGPDSVQPALDRLSAGSSAELLVRGQPLFQKPLRGPADQFETRRDAVTRDWMLSSTQDSFVALAPILPVPTWRIATRIRMDSAMDAGSMAGIIFGWDDRTIGGKSCHAVALWHWNDLFAEADELPGDARAALGNIPGLKVLLIEGNQIVGSHYMPGRQRLPRFLPAIKMPAGKAWRHVEVEVGPRTIRAWFDDAAPPFETTASEVEAAIARLLVTRDLAPETPWAFRPSGPVGIAVSQASISVRELTLKPPSEK